MTCALCREHIAQRCNCSWCQRWRCYNCGQPGGRRGGAALSHATVPCQWCGDNVPAHAIALHVAEHAIRKRPTRSIGEVCARQGVEIVGPAMEPSFRMTVDDVRTRLEAIEALVSQQDYESAHAAEDQLQLDVLHQLSEDGSKLARAALESQAIPFPRRCS